MKAKNYKMKNSNRFVFLPKETFETCNYPEQVLLLQKEREI